MFGKGKHRAGPENGRLRHELKLAEGRLAWYRGRILGLGAQNRTLKNRAEIADGLIAKQLFAIQQRDSRIAQLERLIEASGEDTQQIPIVPEPEPDLAEAVA